MLKPSDRETSTQYKNVQDILSSQHLCHNSSQWNSTYRIRQRFLQYYQALGFQVLPRAPMIHPSIPMSFVMSAGLVQVEMSLARSQLRSEGKFVLVQDCFRHFDLDSAGRDETHLSLFEMPGAFVFGQGVKKLTICNMWKLATEVLKIDRDRLWVSYFAGGELEGNQLPADSETYEAWRDIGISEERLVGLGIDDNFWQQSQESKNARGFREKTKKCGSHTELFYDLGTDRNCGTNCKPGCKCGRFLEFSNSLFISHEIDTDTGKIISLKNPFTETVIGTERVATILQGVSSIFETTEYAAIVDIVRQYSQFNSLPDKMVRESERVITDRAKALCFLVADGAPPPGKNGRQRIIKLLARHTIARMQILGIDEKIFWPVILSSIFKQFKPARMSLSDPKSQEDVLQRVLSYVKSESERFHKTIQRGYREMDKILQNRPYCNPIEPYLVKIEKEWGLPFPLIALQLYQKNVSFSEEAYCEVLKSWKNGIAKK
ncbi:alanine--tRNA ligase-related protein [Geitlerinema sp. CS-897]|nr:alanine--tRNA ligase-related protein [Geitlerinema sp. CS-897]